MTDLQPILPPHSIADGQPLLIAGPCSAESEHQVMTTAMQLSRMGVKVFRAGLWKPRTLPGGFEGVGHKGLSWLKRVKAETGMYVATEVATEQHIGMALDAGIDILWVGARTTASPFAMQQIADTLQGADVPVLVKNPVNPDLELWIGAIQRLYNAGLRRLAAVHRGFTSYEKHLYRNLPHWHIPIELRRRMPQIPIIGDPSHIGGRRDLIAPLAQQALDLGFEGLIIESHCCPDAALSDAAQQLTPSMLQEVLSQLVVHETSAMTETLTELRRQIDGIDNQLLELLAQRMSVSREIGIYKKEQNMPVLQTQRYDEILQKRMSQAEALGMNPKFVKNILEAIHEESVQQQVKLNNPQREC